MNSGDDDDDKFDELEWLALGKATAQTYGILLDRLLRQVVPLNDEIRYWHDILNSTRYTALYSLQMAPSRLWDHSQDVYNEAIQTDDLAQAGWNEFYGIVRAVVKKRSYSDVRAKIAQPVATIREGVRAKATKLERAKRVYATSIGYIMSHRMLPNVGNSKQAGAARDDWHREVTEGVKMLNTALSLSDRVQSADDTTDELVNSLQEQRTSKLDKPSALRSLEEMLDKRIPEQTRASEGLLRSNARPSRLIRYWLPATAIFVSTLILYNPFRCTTTNTACTC